MFPGVVQTSDRKVSLQKALRYDENKAAVCQGSATHSRRVAGQCKARNPLSKQCFSWLDRSNNTWAGKQTWSERCHIPAASLGAVEYSLGQGGVDELAKEDAAHIQRLQRIPAWQLSSPASGTLGVTWCRAHERCLGFSSFFHQCSPDRLRFWNLRRVQETQELGGQTSQCRLRQQPEPPTSAAQRAVAICHSRLQRAGGSDLTRRKRIPQPWDLTE
ncbi:hypothetical protein H8959_002060 [Pygathrix nigripes]